MLPIRQQLDNDDHYEGGNTKEYLIIHDTGNSTDSDEANANYFCGGQRNSSAHYFVDDDSTTQLVLEDNCAFHVGDGKNAYGINNRNSIGIELCRVNDTITETTENNAIELVKYLMNKYNIPIDKVCRHWDASRKSCPEAFMANDWARWHEFKNKLTQENNTKGDEEEVITLPSNFNEKYYLFTNQDINRAYVEGKITDLKEHYLTYGYKEGRSICPTIPVGFNSEQYLLNWKDVRESGMTAENHYLEYGIYEGRSWFPLSVQNIEITKDTVINYIQSNLK
jgi:N-acetylmuramoyl-L-alanine amidase